MYRPEFLDHLRSPRGIGSLPAATHRGEAEDPACGDVLAFDLSVEGAVVREVRFRVRGCPGAIAVGSAFATLLPGRAAREDAVPPEEAERLLGEIPRAKRHALRLARAALAAALAGPVTPSGASPGPARPRGGSPRS